MSRQARTNRRNRRRVNPAALLPPARAKVVTVGRESATVITLEFDHQVTANGDNVFTANGVASDTVTGSNDNLLHVAWAAPVPAAAVIDVVPTDTPLGIVTGAKVLGLPLPVNEG